MKIEWMITDVTADGSPIRVECEAYGLFLTYFGQVIVLFAVEEPPCVLETPS